MLNDFFRINLPYGIAQNNKGEWMAFNREYRPIGFNELSLKGIPGYDYQDIGLYTKYKKSKKKTLEKLAILCPTVYRNDIGEIEKIFLYNDGTNPINTTSKKLRDELWNEYFEKIKILSELSI